MKIITIRGPLIRLKVIDKAGIEEPLETALEHDESSASQTTIGSSSKRFQAQNANWMIDQSDTLRNSSRTRRPPERFNYVAPGQAVYNLHAHSSDRPIIVNVVFFVTMIYIAIRNVVLLISYFFIIFRVLNAPLTAGLSQCKDVLSFAMTILMFLFSMFDSPILCWNEIAVIGW